MQKKLAVRGGFCIFLTSADALPTQPTKNMKVTTTVISNSFTGYSATIRTNGIPAVSTIQKHLRKAKASDCKSNTTIFCNGQGRDLANFGNGPSLIPNGQYA